MHSNSARVTNTLWRLKVVINFIHKFLHWKISDQFDTVYIYYSSDCFVLLYTASSLCMLSHPFFLIHIHKWQCYIFLLIITICIAHQHHTFQSLITDLQTDWPSIPLSSIRDDCIDVKQVCYRCKYQHIPHNNLFLLNLGYGMQTRLCDYT